ncbi:MAG: PAS domain S-box protein, partial [Acidobacteria bacterium]
MLQQLRRQQDALLESGSRLRAVFSVSPDAIVIADDEGRCLETNPAADRLFGLTEAEAVIGKKLSDFVDPGCHFANVWTDLKKHGRYQGEGRVVRS